MSIECSTCNTVGSSCSQCDNIFCQIIRFVKMHFSWKTTLYFSELYNILKYYMDFDDRFMYLLSEIKANIRIVI